MSEQDLARQSYDMRENIDRQNGIPDQAPQKCHAMGREELVKIADESLLEAAEKKGIGYAETNAVEITIDALIAAKAVCVKE